MEAVNNIAKKILTAKGITHWESYAQSCNRLNDTLDGLHIGPRSKDFLVDGIFNFLCNRVTYPQEPGLCCSYAPKEKVSSLRSLKQILCETGIKLFC